jgi:hypothetical protein
MLDLVFPGRRLQFASPLSSEEVTARLTREVVPPVWGRRETRPQIFEGTFVDGRFHMVRLVRGRNSFRPIIEGQVIPLPVGTRIDVRLRLHPIVVILSAILLTVGAVVAVAVASDPEARDAIPAPLFALMAGVLGAVFVGMSVVEGRTATRLLAQLFEAPPSRPAASGAN